jgi:hypothetical protein
LAHLLEILEEPFIVKALRYALHSGQTLPAVALLHADMDIALALGRLSGVLSGRIRKGVCRRISQLN